MEQQSTNQLAKFDPLKANLQVFVKKFEGAKVESKEDATKLITELKDLKTQGKRIEELRVELVTPYNEQVKKINAYAKGLTEIIDATDRSCKAVLLGYERKLEQERQAAAKLAEENRRRELAEAEKRAAEEREKAKTAAMFTEPDDAARAEIVVEVQAEREVVEVETKHAVAVEEIKSHKVSGVRKKWAFEITDPDKVPREYMAVDEKKIRAAVQTFGVRDMPGVRIFEQTSIAI